jgi:hypothetical protein
MLGGMAGMRLAFFPDPHAPRSNDSAVRQARQRKEDIRIDSLLAARRFAHSKRQMAPKRRS